MATPSQKAHLAAFVLNNIGVSFLRCRSSKKSIEAFGYALTIVKDLVTCSHGEPEEAIDQQSRLPPNWLETLVHTASQDLATVTSDSYNESLQDAGPSFCTLDGYNSIVAIQASMQEPSEVPPLSGFLIRVELEGKTLQECDHEDPNLISAIILYNLANAYKYLAATGNEIDSKGHLQCAFKLLHLSYSILDNHCRKDTSENFTDICIPLVILVLKGLMNCATSLGSIGNESNFAECIAFLQEYLQQKEVLYSANEAAAAAAAA